MTSRYDSRLKFKNTLELYDSMLKKRGLNKGIIHYSSPALPKITDEVINELDFAEHTWVTGDKFYKLSHKHYGDPKYWWIISLFNQFPTDHHPNPGDIIYIPKPLERILLLMDV